LPARHRAQLGLVIHDFHHWNSSPYYLHLPFRIHTGNSTPPGVQIAGYIAHELRWDRDLDVHDGLEEAGLRLGERVLERLRAGQLERRRARVDVVVRAVEDLHLDVHYRVARDDALLDRLPDPLLDRRDVLLRDASLGDGVRELEALAAGSRLQAQ